MTRAFKAFIVRDEAPPNSVAEELKKVLSRSEGVELPRETRIREERHEGRHEEERRVGNSLRDDRLATEYAELQLSERKPANLDYVIHEVLGNSSKNRAREDRKVNTVSMVELW